jgi:hypothetical protein
MQVNGRVGQRETLALAGGEQDVPKLAAMPMAMVDTGALIMRMVSKIARPEVICPPGN